MKTCKLFYEKSALVFYGVLTSTIHNTKQHLSYRWDGARLPFCWVLFIKYPYTEMHTLGKMSLCDHVEQNFGNGISSLLSSGQTQLIKYSLNKIKVPRRVKGSKRVLRFCQTICHAKDQKTPPSSSQRTAGWHLLARCFDRLHALGTAEGIVKLRQQLSRNDEASRLKLSDLSWKLQAGINSKHGSHLVGLLMATDSRHTEMAVCC